MKDSSKYPQLLRTAREKANRSVEEMAKSLDISVAAYHDLESFDNEIFDCISLQQIAILDRLLYLNLGTFFSSSSERPKETMSLVDLANKIKEFITTHHITIDEFQEQAGWEGIGKCLENPLEFLKYNIIALINICETVEINWLSVISGINKNNESDKY